MNTAPTQLNLVNAIQAPPAAGKQADAGALDKPFSQVLSNEIAQQRDSSENRENTQIKTGPDDAAQAAEPNEARATSETETTKNEVPTQDPLNPPQTEVSLALAENIPAMPDAMLALAMHPGLLKPVPANTGSALTSGLAEESIALDTTGSVRPDVRQGTARQAVQAGLLDREAARARKSGPALTETAETTARPAPFVIPTATAAVAAFSGQLAAATRQAEMLQPGERLPDLLSNPVFSVSPHAMLDTSAALDSLATSHLAPSVGSMAWSQALGEKVVWMAAGAQQTATLTLNPPNMGPLQIVLSVSNDQATANFFSAQPDVRQALEAAFPRLREMMDEAGIQLGQATVSADTPRQNDTANRETQRSALPFGAEQDASIDLPMAQIPAPRSGRGLVDTFA